MIYDVHTSSAMNYYEELGINQEATEPEIRKAHRRLVKLMHPDAQPDQSLKMLAETQMRRLNLIVATLLDSEQRRQYDDQLIASSQPTYKAQGSLPAWRGIPWWLASAMGAVILTLAAVWLWADHMGSRGGAAVYIPPPENSPASYTPPGPLPQPSVNDRDASPTGSGVSTAVVPDIAPDQSSSAKSEPQTDMQSQAEQSSGPTVSLPNPRQTPVVQKPVTPPPAAALPDPKKQMPKVEAKSLPLLPAKSSVERVPANNLMTKVMTPLPVPKAATALPKAANAPKPAPPKKVFNLPAGSVIARALPPNKGGVSQLPPPPSVASSANRDFSSSAIPSNLPAATPPPKPSVVTTSASGNVAGVNPHDVLEGEWVYSPKEPEKRKAGFYPPEFIDLKLFGAGDPGNLKGQYSAKYVVTDRPVSPEVSFELASTSKGSRKFVWQSSSGAKGTFSIDPIDERTIRIDWRTTSAVRGPALTSGTATLVRRQ